MGTGRLKSLDWNTIRPLRGSQRVGFEELCCQLARRESIPGQVRFSRVGTPDGGVEGFWTTKRKEEHGWQAKFWTSAWQHSQWQQLDESVKKAISSRRRLVKYTVCVPYDRPRETLIKWDAYCARWERLAKQRGRRISFEYWGNSELLERLVKPSSEGLLRFWFDRDEMTPKWFSEHVGKQIKNAGPKYSPDFNVKIPLADEIAWILRSKRAVVTLRAKVHEAVVRARSAIHSVDRAKITGVSTLPVEEHCRQLVDIVTSLSDDPAEDLRLAEIEKVADALNEVLHGLSRTVKEHPDAKGYDKDPWPHDPLAKHKFKSEIYDINRAMNGVSELSGFVCSPHIRLADSRRMVLVGEGGIGKTHLLCDFARRQVNSECPAILILGEQLTGAPPWPQILRNCDLRGESGSEFLATLDAAAETAGCRALLIIDALNEGPGSDFWASHLAGIFDEVSKYRRIAFVVSIRHPYERVVLPEHRDAEDGLIFWHEGFADDVHTACEQFFAHYGLEAPSFPVVEDHFFNPLFLKLFCQAVQNTGRKRLPEGVEGMQRLITFFVESLRHPLFGASYGTIDPTGEIVKAITSKLGTAIADGRRLTRAWVVESINEITGDGRGSQYLTVLLEQGLLRHVPHYDAKFRRIEEWIGFGYERVTDYIVAGAMLDNVMAPARHRNNAFSRTGATRLRSIVADNQHRISLLEALSVCVAERLRRELFEFIPRRKRKRARNLWEAFIGSLTARSAGAVTPRAVTVIQEYVASGTEMLQAMFPLLLDVCYRTGHPLNARFLHGILAPMSMAERDAVWSTFIHGGYLWGSTVRISRLIRWCWHSPSVESINPETAELVGITLAWFLTSSNRFVRDRATKALAHLFSGHLAVARRILHQFYGVNDPYVLERLLCASYGAILRANDQQPALALARDVCDNILAKPEVIPHALIRHYASCIVEFAASQSGDGQLAGCRLAPQYKSKWPRRLPTLKYLEGLFRREKGTLGTAAHVLAMSVGISGDWSRYCVKTHDWSSIPRSEPPPPKNADEGRKLVDQFCSGMTKKQLGAFARYSKAVRSFLGVDRNQEDVNRARKDLRRLLTKSRRARFDEIVDQLLREVSTSWGGFRLPEFSKELVLRFVLKWIANSGWNSRRFGDFDRGIRESGRDAHKAERIGKKYQWIAYHEAMARVSDNVWPQNDISPRSWALQLRDIDPTLLLSETPKADDPPPGGTWWSPEAEASLALTTPVGKWLRSSKDLPNPRLLIEVHHAPNYERGLVLDAAKSISEPTPLGADDFRAAYRHMWWRVDCLLAKAENLKALKDWAKKGISKDSDVEGFHSFYEPYLGEYPSGKIFTDPELEYISRRIWSRYEHFPIDVLLAVDGYSASNSDFDCSVDDAIYISLPAPFIIESLGLKSPRIDGVWYDAENREVACDPCVHEPGKSGLVMTRASMDKLLKKEGLFAFWHICGEKQMLRAEHDQWPGCLVFRWVCWFEDDEFKTIARTRFYAPIVRPAPRHGEGANIRQLGAPRDLSSTGEIGKSN
ncbi:MAG: hypothetical protein ABR964_14625 [Tepidisphaeraceae bacterium]|jgi:hypothetical protein